MAVASMEAVAQGAAWAGPMEREQLSIHLIENHDEAYQVWRRAGVRDRILVHFDAHHDMWWIDSDREVTIANFICPSLREHLVREIYWAVPDRSLQNRAARVELVGQIEAVAKDYKVSGNLIQYSEDKIVVPLPGSRLTVGTAKSLPHFDEPVLLDIDVDYLVIPQVAHEHADTHSELPWCWPSELVHRIADAGLSYDLVTIASSVDGCYTPIAWKYLGSELKARLAGSAGETYGFDEMREGALAASRGEVEQALAHYHRASLHLPASPAPHYQFALLAQKLGRIDDARASCGRALELDPTYASGFNNLGLHYLWQRRIVDAENEFLRALDLNPGDAYAMVGMARVAAVRKRWQEAVRWASAALAVSDDNLDAHRCTAAAYARLGQIGSAISHYERSLQLGMHGHKPLSWQILTCTRPGQVIDEDHCATYAELGRLRALRGDLNGAIACYRIALSSTFDGVRERVRLAHLYLKTGRREDAALQLKLADHQLPRSLKIHTRRWWRALADRVKPRFTGRGLA